jgi:hypothetical protein
VAEVVKSPLASFTTSKTIILCVSLTYLGGNLESALCVQAEKSIISLHGGFNKMQPATLSVAKILFSWPKVVSDQEEMLGKEQST